MASIIALMVFTSAVCAHAQYVLSNIWSISTTAGAPYTYINTDGTQRGIAYNSTTNHVYVVSRTGSAAVYVLDGSTGAHIGNLDVTGVSGGGGGAINLVDCTEDGQIYICNLATSAGTFRLYRYTNEVSPPVLVYVGDPTSADTNAVVTNSKRFGDNMATRGTGTNVQVLVHSRGGRASGLLYPIDDTINSFTNQTILTDAANGDMGVGAAFGNNDTFWSKAPSRPLRRHGIANPSAIYDPTTALVSTSQVSIALSPATTSGLHSLPQSNLLAVVDYGGHTVRLYDTSSGTGVALQDFKSFPLPAAANANGTSEPSFGVYNGTMFLYGVDANNGVAATQLLPVTAPVVGTSPSDVSILDGGFGALTATANGSAPLVYRWIFTNNNSTVGIFTNSGVLPLTNVTAATAGGYQAIVTNSAGAATSGVAIVTILPSVLTTEAAKLWQLVPGSRPYLTIDYSQRGLAFNAPSNHVLVATRAPSVGVYVLDAITGATITNLDMTGVGGQTGETFPINMVGVADDGVVYVCNLANTANGGSFTIYRWADDAPATQATIAYGPDNPLGERIGDTFAVTGSGVNTKLLAASRNGTKVAVFTTADGLSFSANVVDASLAPSPAPAGFAGLGLAPGDGDSFWGAAGTLGLRKVVYDLVNGTNDVVAQLTGQTGNNIGADNVNQLVASVGTGDTPSNLRILDVSNPASGTAVLVDQEFFGADNENINGTGGVAFDVVGGRVFALDSNNGLIALKYAPRVKQNGNVLTWTGPGALQSATVVTGPYNDVGGATSPFTTNVTDAVFFRVRR